ncbi:eukaryotic translation initiation factor 2A-like, partial [Agrilus planipennis]
MATSIPIAVRSSIGVSMGLGPPDYKNLDAFTPVISKTCRTMLFSPDGRYFAYVNGQRLHIVKTDNWKDVAVNEGVKAYYLAFSPLGTYLMSWEPFTVSNANPQASPNLHIYKCETGELVKSLIHKKQSNWEPQWSADERVFSRLIGSDITFCEDFNLDKVVYRINSCKIASYTLSPSATGSVYYVLCHILGLPGQPSFGRLFKYPNFENQQAVANKSFFQADKVEYYWNPNGTSALLLTNTEVDKTGGSYYGKQGLHFISTSGEVAIVTLSKEGPIYSVAWSPKGHEFCVVYGFMPARATLYNTKCESVFELGGGPQNSIYYNPFGNILLIGGFGNLRGQIQLWDANSRKLIGTCEAPDSTLLHWSPDGVYFLTATTSPRLRIGNGYKIWHYSGTLIFERPWSQQDELYDVFWKPVPKDTFKEPKISSEKVDGIQPAQPQASKQVYRPPSARNRPTVAFNLHDDTDDLRPGSAKGPSKQALKQRKKRENRKARKQDEKDEDEVEPIPVSDNNVKVSLTGDTEKDKKIKNIKKKLD